MKRRRRELAIFTLSALDVLAMSTGVFVLLLVMLMPYYRKVQDAEAATEAVRIAEVATLAEVEAVRRDARLLGGEAAALEAEVARLEAAAARIEAENAARERRMLARSIEEVPGGGDVDTPVIDRLDLVFVIDTTASMGPVLREVASTLESVVRILESLVPSVRLAVVAYRDRDTGLAPLRVLPFHPAERDLARIEAFLRELAASPVGSRTIEEDVDLGLQAALAMPYRAGARQAVILVGDAAAHPGEERLAIERARHFAGRDVRRTVSTLFTPTPSSIRRGNRARGFFREVALAGRGDFNDHAGSMIESVLLSVLVDPAG
ncbi:MAG TPA: vWA domain-containing protein [Geminicoccaceae bacterium]